jgi:hypothetical protein
MMMAALYRGKQRIKRCLLASELGKDSSIINSIEFITERVQLLSIESAPIIPSSVSGNRH